MPKPSVRDVAARAGVGLGTVSRVLNNSPQVRRATRERVLRAMNELGYLHAPARRHGSARRVTVLAPFASYPSVAERLRGVSEVLSADDGDLTLVDVATPEQRDRLYDAVIVDRHDAGLLVISLAPTDAEAERLARSPAPVVLLDCEHPRLARVVIDDVHGGALAARHLLALGHRRVGFVGDVTDERFRFVSSARRLKGFAGELAHAGEPLDERRVRRGPHGRADSRRMAAELLSLDAPPTAIFAASDLQALGVLDAAVDAGLQVPDDLSVVSFDDLDVAGYVGLTAVHQPLRESGALAARLLRERLRDPAAEPAVHVLGLELVHRRTTAPARH